jgi:7,8-dihydropterin-6-yl-methyl-4-(beta-D-ribofuranosyl)aminobenzene 5'-phosphate synthase
MFGLMLTTQAKGEEMTLSIVYNNVAYDSNLTCSWGMAAVVTGLSKTVLFDTGGNGDVLIANMKKIGLDPKRVDLVVLSHNHGDHTGGLWKFLELNSDVTVYMPASFPSSFERKVERSGARTVRVHDPIEIIPGVYSTGELGKAIHEQALVVESSEGLIVVTGCAHPGIDRIAEMAATLTTKTGDDTVYLITGGFHLGGASERVITKTIEELRELGVIKIAPSHCTGDKAIARFRQEWGDDFLELGCGATLEMPR